jgi:hypothetical protein
MIIPILITGVLVINNNMTAKDNITSKEYAKKMIQLPPSGKVDDDFINDIEDRISRIPSKLIAELYKKGVRIFLYDGPITDLFSNLKGKEYEGVKYEECAGVFYDPDIGIRVDNNYILGAELHEIGHAVDFCLGDNISLNKEFLFIYNNEGKNYLILKILNIILVIQKSTLHRHFIIITWVMIRENG